MSTENNQNSTPAPRGQNATKYFALIIVLVIVFFTARSCFSAYENGEEEAAAACQMAIEDRTAHLDGRKVTPQNSIDLGNDSYRASGEVKWQGKTSSYSCTIELDNASDEWVVTVTGKPTF